MSGRIVSAFGWNVMACGSLSYVEQASCLLVVCFFVVLQQQSKQRQLYRLRFSVLVHVFLMNRLEACSTWGKLPTGTHA
jgi:hypothetical protein